MDTLTACEQAQFERAVAQFVGEGEVRVTDESIRAFLDEMGAWSDDLAEDRIVNLDELVDAATRTLGDPGLLSRVRELSQRFDWLETRYPRLRDAAPGETKPRDARSGSEPT